MKGPIKSVSLSKAHSKSTVSDLVLTQSDFQQIVQALFNESGIHIPESKTAFVQARLSKRLHSLGLRSFREYCELITHVEGVSERQKMVAALTTNITRFFREPHHLEDLKNKVLPRLIDLAKKGGRIRLWSAGCSTGQEPYSIALTLLALAPNISSYDVRILATDIDSDVLSVGRNGYYSEKELSGVPRGLRERWFIQQDNSQQEKRKWIAASELKKLIVFRELNLNGPWPMRGDFQAIFCRNFVIYFDQETQMRLWDRFASILAPGGTLYLGHSESLSGPAASNFFYDGTTTYRRRDNPDSVNLSTISYKSEDENKQLFIFL